MQRTRAPRVPALDTRLLRRVPHLPPALVLELVAHECDHVLEGDTGLLEARCGDHRLATRYGQRTVQGRRRNPRQERRLAIPARDTEPRRLDARRERSPQEPALPRQNGERLPR